MAKAYAYLNGRDFVMPEDVAAIFPDVCAHRLMLNSKARMMEEKPESVLASPAMVTPQAVSQSTSGNFMVQVGAVSDQARAQQYQQQLGQKFGVPGRVTQNGAVWRIQLGPFASKAEASTLQQRLQTEAQLQSFITTAQ